MSAESALTWQKRYLTPALLVVACLVMVGVLLAGGVAVWLGVLILAFCVFGLVTTVVANHRAEQQAEAS
ncbi:MAG: hypothetical protein ACR2PK_16675 [Acidimicrobiales bacterium]